MKGFVHLIEVAIAGLILVTALGTFFSAQTTRLDWERPDLIEYGDNMINFVVSGENFRDVISENTTALNMSKPVNVDYTMRVIGTPANNITVGCFEYCDQIRDMLSKPIINNRNISFDVEYFDIDTVSIIPDYDALVTLKYIDFDTNQKIQDYIDNGGYVVGVTDIPTGQMSRLDETFDLISGNPNSNSIMLIYRPERDYISKYFLGIGFEIETHLYLGPSLQKGYWNLTEDTFEINNTGSMIYVDLGGGTQGPYSEGDEFATPSASEWFIVKKIPDKYSVWIRPLNKNFVFDGNFLNGEDCVISSDNNIIKRSGTTTCAASVLSDAGVWISDFTNSARHPRSHEYETLLQAAVVSSKIEWDVVGNKNIGEAVGVTNFVNMCKGLNNCDTNEIVELIFLLWYQY